MSTLHSTINALAAEFAHELLAALRGASLEEIIAETHGTHRTVKRERPSASFVASPMKRGRLARRSEDDLKRLADRIVALVLSNKDGVNAERIKSTLKLQRKELPRPLMMALKTKKIRKRGQKRATTYFKA